MITISLTVYALIKGICLLSRSFSCQNLLDNWLLLLGRYFIFRVRLITSWLGLTVTVIVFVS